MAITDPHDPRQFRRYVSFNPDGTVAAVHDFAAGAICPLQAAVEVTDLAPFNFDAITIAPAVVAAIDAAVEAHAKQSATVDQAVADLAVAASALSLVQASTRGAISVAVAKVQLGAAAPIEAVLTNGG